MNSFNPRNNIRVTSSLDINMVTKVKSVRWNLKMSCQSIWDRHRYVVTVRNALGCIIYNAKLQRKSFLHGNESFSSRKLETFRLSTLPQVFAFSRKIHCTKNEVFH